MQVVSEHNESKLLSETEEKFIHLLATIAVTNTLKKSHENEEGHPLPAHQQRQTKHRIH